MKIERVNPPGTVVPSVYSQAVKVTGGSLLILAGQVAWDEEGKTVGEGDLGAQATQAFRNVKSILAAFGADMSNVLKLTIYVVNYQYEDRAAIVEAFRSELDSDHLPASTLLGVQSLARPDLLIEIEATAALDD